MFMRVIYMCTCMHTYIYKQMIQILLTYMFECSSITFTHTHTHTHTICYFHNSKFYRAGPKESCSFIPFPLKITHALIY